ncbi:MAG TPA: MoxR family ATPase [Candidatus Paceibacterota bacterium]|nr:MoxR family ATPase [Candidatus Paceibacterota bacterium]
MRGEEAREKIKLVAAQPRKWLFGIDRAIDELVEAMFTLIPYTAHGRKELGQAHVLLRDVPGVGKTDLIRSLSFAVGATSSLVSGHPELMPRDIMGGEIYIGHTGKFFLRKGPIFSHMFLFDEINRAHAKTQAPTLQAMEERIAILEETDVDMKGYRKVEFPLLPVGDAPDERRLFFWFLATANPVEQEGTYELPEAQLDRFTYSLRIGYPARDCEMRIRAGNVVGGSDGVRPTIENVISLPEALDVSELIFKEIESSGGQAKRANEYIQRLVENSRPESAARASAKKSLRDCVDLNVRMKGGLSPRANFHFEAAARTNAFLHGNGRFVTVDDVKSVAVRIMNHRIQLTGSAKGRGITGEDVAREIIEGTVAP